LPLLEDPDRYAVAATLAISRKYKLKSQESAEIAANWFSANRPETIRQKARKAWAGRARRKNGNPWIDMWWLRVVDHLIAVGLQFEGIDYSQQVTCVKEAASIFGEGHLARKIVLPLIGALRRKKSK
jgi:hypothetical protein